MPVNYNIAKCKNPAGVEGTDYYSFEDLAADLSLATTVTRGDALAVLASIKPFVTKALLGGRRVVLDDLGAIQLGVRSKCFPRLRWTPPTSPPRPRSRATACASASRASSRPTSRGT